MLWYCRFTWFPATTTERVRQRVLQQHAAGTNHPEKIKGWYNLAGGGAGFLLVDSDDPRDLNAILEPYMDLVSWDVHAAYELPYETVTDHFNDMIRASSRTATSPEQNKAIIRRCFDDFNRGDLSFIDECFSESYVGHAAGTTDIQGRQPLREMLQNYRSSFSDMRGTIDDVVAEGDRVVVRATMTGIHRGEFQGVAPTGKQVTLCEMDCFRFGGGKIVEAWSNADDLGLLRQLGALPRETGVEIEEEIEAADVLRTQQTAYQP